MKGLRILLLFVFISSMCFAQNKTYFGVEGAITNDLYEILEYGNMLKQIPLVGLRSGFNIRHDLNDFVAIETGLVSKRIREGFGFETIPGGGSGTAVHAWCIPLRLYTKINLSKKKIFISPVLGLSYCISPDNYGSGEMNGQYKGMTDSVTFYSYTYYGHVKNFVLLQSGLSLDFVLKRGSIFSIFSNYMIGTSRLFEANITYKYNDHDWVNGRAFSNGSYWDIGVSFKYPISNFWKKNKKE